MKNFLANHRFTVFLWSGLTAIAGLLTFQFVADGPWLFRVSEANLALAGQRLLSGEKPYVDFYRSDGVLGYAISAAMEYLRPGFALSTDRLLAVALLTINMVCLGLILSKLNIRNRMLHFALGLVFVSTPHWANFYYQSEMIIQTLFLFFATILTSTRAVAKYWVGPLLFGVLSVLILNIRVLPGILTIFMGSPALVLFFPDNKKNALMIYSGMLTLGLAIIVFYLNLYGALNNFIEQAIRTPAVVYWPYQFVPDGIWLDLAQAVLVILSLIISKPLVAAYLLLGLSGLVTAYSTYSRIHMNYYNSYMPWFLLAGTLLVVLVQRNKLSTDLKKVSLISILNLSVAIPLYYEKIPFYSLPFLLVMLIVLYQELTKGSFNKAFFAVLVLAILQLSIPNFIVERNSDQKIWNETLNLYIPQSMQSELDEAQKAIAGLDISSGILVAPLWPIFYLAMKSRPIYNYDLFYPPYMKEIGKKKFVEFVKSNPHIPVLVNNAPRFLVYKFPNEGQDEHSIFLNVIPGLSDALRDRQVSKIGKFIVYSRQL